MEERLEKWLSGPYDAETKAEIRRLMKDHPQELIDAFYRDLSFGTGGMRAIMGIGSNRMNIYTVRMATQGLANTLLESFDHPRVFIGYDVRKNSRLFAEEAARVFAANGIEALITREVCPTPLASFGCRHENCSAAVIITASHNPPEYNGYKVYWKGGGQIVPPYDAAIIKHVRQIESPEEVRLAPLSHPLIRWIDETIDEAYLQNLDRLRLCPNATLNIVYSNLHGTGLRLMPKALGRRGWQCKIVEAQKSYDGHFPEAPIPNPEEEAALSLGTKVLLAEKADLLFATDPDSDRLGVVVRHRREACRLNGHQIACLSFFHLANTLHSKGSLPKNCAIIKTIVTTEMVKKIADRYAIQCFDVLTGFKYIAELMGVWEKTGGPKFLFGAEESHGYLHGSFVRDKDAIGAACLLGEAAQMAKEENLTLIDRLNELYRTYGVYRQSLTTIALEDSPQGLEKMQAQMRSLRQNPPPAINGIEVLSSEDYLTKEAVICRTGQKTPLNLPVSDVLRFWLVDGSKLVIRPSGTEPKIKIYAEVSCPPAADLDAAIEQCDQRLCELLNSFKAGFISN